MAISGGAVPALQVWLEKGVLQTGYSMHANGDVVVEDVLEVATRIRAGERVLMLRQGFNFTLLSFVIERGLYPQGEAS